MRDLLQQIIESKKKRKGEAIARANRAYESYIRNIRIADKLQSQINDLEKTIAIIHGSGNQ